MNKSCPFCKKRIKDENTCPHCKRVIIEKFEQKSDQSGMKNRDHQHKKTSGWLRKPFKLTRGWVIGGLILLALGYFIWLNNIKTTQQSVQETTPVTPKKCTRTIPYSMPPEFERALSLIKQRFSQYNPNTQDAEYDNCLNIQYSDLKRIESGAEGVFILDRSVSNPNNLVIYVDRSYQGYDDLLTAILLVHEITHASQYYNSVVYDKDLKSCMEEEVIAFQAQFNFLKTLNEEERNTIFSRLNIWTMGGYIASDANKQLTNPALKNLSQMITIFLNAAKYKCKMEQTCTLNLTMQGIRDMVENSPAYQKQCNTK